MGHVLPLSCRARRAGVTSSDTSIPAAGIPTTANPSTRSARRRLVRALVAVVVLGAVGAPAAGDVHADNILTSSNPADGASLPASPEALQFTFAEPLGPQNQIIVTCNGDPFSVGNATVQADAVTLVAAVPTPMPKGTCNAVATVSAVDSSPNGSAGISFTITADPAATTVDTASADTVAADATPPGDASATAADADEEEGGTDVGGPLGLARLVTMLALATLLGAFALIVLAWPEGVEYILTVRFLRTAWVVAAVGAVLTVVLLTVDRTGRTFAESLSPVAWFDIADTTSGIAALGRAALAIGCGWAVVRPERVLDPATQLPALAAPVGAVATLGLARTGGDLALLGAVMGVAHALAMAVWLGGVVLLARVVLAGPGDEDLVHAVRGFSRIATPALLITIVTGAVQTYRLDRGGLFDTSHGQVLLLKALIVGATVFVSLATRQFVASRLRGIDAMSVPLASRLRRATSFEALGGVVILALSAWLLALTPVGAVDGGETVTYPYSGRFVDASQNLDLTVSLTGGVGPNGVRVEVVEPADGLGPIEVTFLPPADAVAPGVVLTLPAELDGAGVAVLPQAEGVPLDVAGVWTLAVSVTAPSGEVVEGRKTFNVLAPAP